MLYIMRHGRTDWNVRHKLQGRTDIPLNDEGRMMAAEAGKQYSDIHFDICYSSPLERAKETADIFLKGRNVPVYTDDRLVEMGESFEELFARTGEFIDNVVMPQVNSGKDILIVGHGAMNCSIIAKFRGTPLDKFWDGMTDNCQVVRLI